jgi:predicted RNA methylase
MLSDFVDDADRQKMKTSDYDGEGDGVVGAVGYNLGSVWYDVPFNTEASIWMLPLPDNPQYTGSKSWIKAAYSRTSPGITDRLIRTYMRKGDRFFEMCCGWMTFSSAAKFAGYSGKGGDIWDTSIEFCKQQIKKMPGAGKVDVIRADCTNTKEPPGSYDFVHSNPPFFNLEPYGNAEADLASTGSYGRWLKAMGKMGAEAERILRRGGLANFVINDYRKDGNLVLMHADFVRAIQDASGLLLHDLVVAHVRSLRISFRKQDYEQRRTTKCHEYIATFKKG